MGVTLVQQKIEFSQGPWPFGEVMFCSLVSVVSLYSLGCPIPMRLGRENRLSCQSSVQSSAGSLSSRIYPEGNPRNKQSKGK